MMLYVNFRELIVMNSDEKPDLLNSFPLEALGEKLLPDGDFSGYVENGNASTRPGFFTESNT